MSEYFISKVSPTDRRAQEQIDKLLVMEGIRRDANLDYTCAMYDDNYDVIATGSCFGNTLRCMAVSSSHQGEGLMNEIVSHLMEYQFNRQNYHMFLYTKCSSSKFFSSLGFYEIQRVEDNVVFMENKKTGFSDYLRDLASSNLIIPEQLSKNMDTLKPDARISAVVMNANPFTNGHLYLVEQAAAESDLLHIFMVSEDASLVPFEVRKKLIMDGTKHLDNVVYHESGPYIISSSTFPSYFQKDSASVIEGHALLDLSIFIQIAKYLHINMRFVGDEPTSMVTGIYNRIMSEQLPEHGIGCTIIKRKEAEGKAISASTVRSFIHEGNWEELKKLVPETTYNYFMSEEAKPVIEKIKASTDVVHY